MLCTLSKSRTLVDMSDVFRNSPLRDDAESVSAVFVVVCVFVIGGDSAGGVDLK